MQQASGHLSGRVYARFAKVRRDVWVDVERALWLHAGDARNLGQGLERLIAQLEAIGLHAGHTFLWPVQSLDRGLLDHVRGAGSALTLQLRHSADHWRRPQTVTQTPAR